MKLNVGTAWYLLPGINLMLAIRRLEILAGGRKRAENIYFTHKLCFSSKKEKIVCDIKHISRWKLSRVQMNDERRVDDDGILVF